MTATQSANPGDQVVALAKKLGRLAYVRIGVYEVAAFLIYATKRVG
jgi:hypothetical protein